MPVLPIPMIIALVLFAFLVQRIVKGETHATLLALIAVCATQGAILALVQYYGFSFLRPVQPVLATVIPPVAWFAFMRASGSEGPQRKVFLHAIGPALALLCLAVNPNLLDILIPLSFTIYGAAMFVRLWSGEDSLPHSRLENGPSALIAWRIIAFALIASAASDVLIAYGLAVGHSGVLLWVPSLVSLGSLLSLGALSLTHAIESRREQLAEEAVPSKENLERDQAIIARLDDYVRVHKPHLDPDLTLARLARKLTVPAKQVSAAINRSKNENVSRYINRLRIEEACRLLAEGKSVTAAIFDSGFNTKSNFNREFLRVCGQNPRQWLAAREQ
jgi:AraC-like DNA-binding protein